MRSSCRAVLPILLLVLSCLVPGTSSWAAGLPRPVREALREAGIPEKAVAVTVQEVDSGRPRVAWNTARAMNPASVMKLVTTYASLDLLGPAYAWPTEAWHTGRIDGGVLSGDLYIRGSGDPYLTIERFDLLLHELKARGVHDIRGNLIVDRSVFEVAQGSPAAFDGEGLSPYNAFPDGLLLNFNALRLTLVPRHNGVAVLPMPELAGLLLENRLTPGSGPCGDWEEVLKANWQPSSMRLTLTGSFPASCGERIWNLSILTPPQYVFRAFRPLWHELGGSLAGDLKEARVPGNAQFLSAIESPPLREIIQDINKYSNNVMARQLFLSLGAEPLKRSRAATPADGSVAIRSWLKAKKLAMPELVIENGSGLSRQARISAASLNRLLLSAWKSPWMPEFVSSLPIVAVDGTMKRRLGDTGVAGRGHIKTGSLADAKSIAGYIMARNGRRYAVVFLVNHPGASAAKPAQDALLQWVWAGAR